MICTDQSVILSPSSLSSRDIRELEGEYFLSAATETDLTFDHALGSVVVDADGREYLDLACGVLITNLGHAHPRVTSALERAAGRSPASYNLGTDLRATLCQRLAAALPGDLKRTAFFSSGSEAVDAAVRLARQATGREEVLSFRGAFHGRSYLALSVSGKKGLRVGVGAGVPGVVHLPYPDRDDDVDEAAWRTEVQRVLAAVSSDNVAAILSEPYQGSGGVIVPPDWFLPALRELADSQGALLIVDEVQSGFGRTGSLFATEQCGIVPDIVVLGKAMGNGVPIASISTTDEVAAKARPGSLSSTFGGNVLVCAAAHGVLDAFAHDGVLEQGRHLATSLAPALSDLLALPCVSRVRTWGLAIGVELAEGAILNSASLAKRVVRDARAENVILIPPIGLFSNVLRIAPALTMDAGRALEGVATVRRVLERAVRDDER